MESDTLFENAISRVLSLENVLKPTFLLLHETSACMHEGRRPYFLPCALWISSLFYIRSCGVRRQHDFPDPHRNSASISRIDIRLSVSSRYTFTHTVSPHVKEAWALCLVTLPLKHSRVSGSMHNFPLSL